MDGFQNLNINREIVFYHENSSVLDRNVKAETGFSKDAEIESEDAPILMYQPKLNPY